VGDLRCNAVSDDYLFNSMKNILLAGMIGVLFYAFCFFFAAYAVVKTIVWLVGIVLFLAKWAAILTAIGVVVYCVGCVVVGLLTSRSIWKWVSRHRVTTGTTVASVVVLSLYLLLSHGRVTESPPAVTLANMQLRNDGWWTRTTIQTRLRFEEPVLFDLGLGPSVNVGGHLFRAEHGRWVEQ
jgi:hypothetical protein